MPVDPDAARAFAAVHARPLDRLRLALALGDSPDPDSLMDALSVYARPGGGYGMGLEPDLRAEEAQPAAALHAFEVFEEMAPATDARAADLCDWLARVTLPGGGLPFALPVRDARGCAPFWARADPTVPSLQITAAVLRPVLRVARHDAAVARHPWPARAVDHCLDAIAGADTPLHAIALMFSVRLLDALSDDEPWVQAQRERLWAQIPPSGRVHVVGGADDEFMRPLDFAPLPTDPVRRHIAAPRVDEDLERLAAGQAADGGWTADWVSYSPEATREWRGYLTVRAIRVLRANGVID